MSGFPAFWFATLFDVTENVGMPLIGSTSVGVNVHPVKDPAQTAKISTFRFFKIAPFSL